MMISKYTTAASAIYMALALILTGIYVATLPVRFVVDVVGWLF